MKWAQENASKALLRLHGGYPYHSVTPPPPLSLLYRGLRFLKDHRRAEGGGVKIFLEKLKGGEKRRGR